MKKSKFTNNISLILIFSFVMLFLGYVKVFASGSNFQLPSFLDKYEVYSGGNNYTPNYSDYPFNKNTVEAIGFNKLYSSDKGFFKYKGEVSNITSTEDYAKKYRVYNGNQIDGRNRPFANQTISKDDLKPSNKDPHIWSMTTNSSGFSMGSIGLAIVSFVNWIFTMLINLMIALKSFDVSTIINIIDSDGSFSKLLSSIFLIDTKTGAISPFLIFSLLLFIASFISLSFKAIKGRASFRNIASELGFFLIAIVIASMFLNTGNASILSKTGTDFMTSLANKASLSTSKSSSIFEYSSGNADVDSNETQRAIISKTYIDQLISSQFGYSVNDLYIMNGEGVGNFGTKMEVQEAMQKTFGNDASIDSMSVVTDIAGKNKINNLGYYLWAANSGVAIYDGTNKTKPAFYSSGNGTLIRTGSSDRMLYAVDFLSNVRTIQAAKGDTGLAIVSKIDKIMNNLTSPSYSTAIANTFAITIQNIALSYSLFSIAIFETVGRMIIVFGSYCMVILPVLILFKGSRSTAKKMTWSYMIGFLRYLIGSALFSVIIILSTLLAQQGFMGIIISAILCIILGKFGPKLIKEINQQMTQFGRGKELGSMSNMYHKMDRSLDKYTNKSKRNSSAYILNESGEIEKDTSNLQKIQEGLRKGENPFETESGINPFGEKRSQYKRDEVDKFNSSKKIDEKDLSSILVDKDGNKSELDEKGNPVETKTTESDRDIIGEEDEKDDTNIDSNGVGNSIVEDEKDIAPGIQGIEAFEQSSDSQIRNGRSLLGEDEGEGLEELGMKTSIANVNSNGVGNSVIDDGKDLSSDEKIANNQINDEKSLSNHTNDKSLSNEIKNEPKLKNIDVNKEPLEFNESNNIEELSDKEKYKFQTKSRKKLKLKNTVLKTINNVPLFGNTLNQYAANKMSQPYKNKSELLKSTLDHSLDNGENLPLTLDEAIENSKNEILNSASHTTRKNKSNSIDKAKNLINKSDVEKLKIDIDKKIKLNKK